MTSRGEAVKVVIGTIRPGKAQDSIMLVGLKVFILLLYPLLLPSLEKTRADDSDSPWMETMSLVKPQSLVLLQALTLLTALKLWTYSLRTVGHLNDPRECMFKFRSPWLSKMAHTLSARPVEDS